MHQLASTDSIPEQTLLFSNQSRLMLIAPHPDDESLACGITLQAAMRNGAAVRVIYATDGDNNPWPQRFMERKWRIRQADRLRWGQLRRREAQAALSTLGLPPENAHFLGLPDQGLTDLLMRDRVFMVSIFWKLIEDFRPTDIIFPSTADAHPDHNAVALLLVLLLRDLPSAIAPESAWQFAIHGSNPAFFANARRIGASPAEIATKVKAIKCHETQLRLSRKRFLRYAERPERYFALDGATLPTSAEAPQVLARGPRQLTVSLPPQKKVFGNRLNLLAIGHSPTGKPSSAAVRFSPKSTTATMIDCVTGIRGAQVSLAGNPLAGMKITLPTEGIFSPGHPIFLKLNRRTLGFADAGWCEVPALETRLAPARSSYLEPILQIA